MRRRTPSSTEPGRSPAQPDAAARFERPRIVVSQCLELAAVRYNGQSVRAPIVRRLDPYADLIAVCPEVGIGLGVPRDPIQLVRAQGGVRLWQPSSGRDLTHAMQDFAGEFLGRIGPVDGFILKSRSPSCGVGDAKLYAGPADDAVAVDLTSGRFAEAVLQRFPEAATEDEVGLADTARRHHWLTRVFVYAALRAALALEGEDALPAFHATHRVLLAMYDPAAAERLARIVADAAGGRSADAYASAVRSILRRPPDPLHRATVQRWTDRLGEDAPAVRRCRRPYPATLLNGGSSRCP